MTKRAHALLVVRHSVILEVPANRRDQILRRRTVRLVPPLSQLPPYVLQLGRHALGDRLAVHREIPLLATSSTDMGETEKVERLRLPFPSLLPALGGIAPKFDQARLFRV